MSFYRSPHWVGKSSDVIIEIVNQEVANFFRKHAR